MGNQIYWACDFVGTISNGGEAVALTAPADAGEKPVGTGSRFCAVGWQVTGLARARQYLLAHCWCPMAQDFFGGAMVCQRDCGRVASSPDWWLLPDAWEIGGIHRSAGAGRMLAGIGWWAQQNSSRACSFPPRALNYNALVRREDCFNKRKSLQ